MTRYIAAYDTETPACLEACRKIVEIHRRHEMPATFFIVGQVLQANADDYRRLLDDPLFEVASHTWSHKLLRDHPLCGPAAAPQQVREEVLRGVDAVERVFRRDCIGFRPAVCFDDALRGATNVLEHLRQAGVQYVSSLGWGPDYTLPALLTEPFNYHEDGFADLWELPAHGWHENLLKNHNGWGPRRLTAWPPLMPEAIPAAFIKTPREEVAINRVFLERAARDALPFVSLLWHPWSLAKFDRDQEMLDQTFRLVRELGLQPSTYANLYKQVAVAEVAK